MILFAKAPLEGRVKTRLAAEIGARRAVALHRAFVSETIAKLKKFTSIADIELHTDISTDAWSELDVAREVQIPGGLHGNVRRGRVVCAGGSGTNRACRGRLRAKCGAWGSRVAWSGGEGRRLS